jgi:prepilin-type processing-associated H-X9-DG protein
VLICPTKGKNTPNGYAYDGKYCGGKALGDMDAMTTWLTADASSSSIANIGYKPIHMDVRHSGKAIVSFVDGHVASVSPPRTVFPNLPVYQKNVNGVVAVYYEDGNATGFFYGGSSEVETPTPDENPCTGKKCWRNPGNNRTENNYSNYGTFISASHMLRGWYFVPETSACSAFYIALNVGGAWKVVGFGSTSVGESNPPGTGSWYIVLTAKTTPLVKGEWTQFEASATDFGQSANFILDKMTNAAKGGDIYYDGIRVDPR